MVAAGPASTKSKRHHAAISSNGSLMNDPASPEVRSLASRDVRASSGELRLTSLDFSTLDVELTTPFGIATGAQHVAHNVLVRLTLSNGIVGYGEAAPFPAVSGETQAQVLAARVDSWDALADLDLRKYREASARCASVLGSVPSARAAVEIALLDALCRSWSMSLLDFFGGAQTSLETDITLVTGSVEETREAARRAVGLGFSTLKVKVGGSSVDEDAKRLLAVTAIAPQARLLLDANCGFDVTQSLALLDALGSARDRVVLFEQPTPREDLDALAEVERRGHVPVAADESLRGQADLRRLVQTGGISAINIKTAKFGLVEAHDILVAGRALGFRLMIGGMVETELSMSASACLAAGVGGVSFVDLDTPLFMKERPLEGGFVQNGPHLALASIREGHGVSPTR